MARPRKPVRQNSQGVHAVMYVRVSTAEQVKGYGPDAQVAACQAYVQRMGYTLVNSFEDMGISGTKAPGDDRTGLRDALAFCASGKADVLVCYAQDRLARKSAVFDTIRETAIKHRFRIETAREGYDLTTDESELPAGLTAFMAWYEGRMIAKRLRAGRVERSRIDGLGSGFIPFGYALTSDKRLIVDEEAAKTIRRLFALRRKNTYRQTVERLNQEELAAPQGGKWNVGQVQRIEKSAHLYRTGERIWDGITAQQRWPVILQSRKAEANDDLH